MNKTVKRIKSFHTVRESAWQVESARLDNFSALSRSRTQHARAHAIICRSNRLARDFYNFENQRFWNSFCFNLTPFIVNCFQKYHLLCKVEHKLSRCSVAFPSRRKVVENVPEPELRSTRPLKFKFILVWNIQTRLWICGDLMASTLEVSNALNLL